MVCVLNRNRNLTRLTWFHGGLLMSFEEIVLMVGAHLFTKSMQKALSLIPSPCNKVGYPHILF